MNILTLKSVGCILCIPVMTAACGPRDKSTASNRISDWNHSSEIHTEEQKCVNNTAPRILGLEINREVFCDQGLAHLIVDAEDADSERLEFQIKTDAAEEERDGESPKAAYISGLRTDQNYRLLVSVGDGCTLLREVYTLDGPTVCAPRPFEGKEDPMSENAYVLLSPPASPPL